VRKQRGAKQAVLEIEAPKDLRSLARNGLSKIAARELKARGAEEGRRSSIRLGTAAVSREVAAERSGRSPSRSGCWGSTRRTSTTQKRRMPCELLAGESDKQLSLHQFVL